MITINIPASVEQILVLQQNISAALPEKYQELSFKAELITEELLTNICKYASNDGKTEISFACGMSFIDSHPAFLIELTNTGDEFNPFTHLKQSGIEGSLEERSVGGVGLHLVLEMASHFVYSWIDNRNKIQIFLNAE
ncbi:MAG: ATP-binding protein [Succinimonas sp.]|jgi:anti-sigma regulatory factor (Ser/Thr protein kinase)|nr:ATP-binding protein [Succinimonas sp.]MEE3422304.1 ATP-binding protein [Succinimonas sp.]